MRRRMRDGQALHFPRKRLHLGGVASLAPQRHDRVLAGKRRGKRREGSFFLRQREQID